MKWRRQGNAAVLESKDDPLETHADAAQEHYGFTDEERTEFLKMQRALAGNPALLKKLVKRQRKFLKAQGMTPTIKTRRKRGR